MIPRILGFLLLTIFLAAFSYFVIGFTLWQWNPQFWPEMARIGYLILIGVSHYLWQGGTLRNALERVW